MYRKPRPEIRPPSLNYPPNRMTLTIAVEAIKNQYQVVKAMMEAWENLHPMAWEYRIETVEYENEILKKKVASLEKKVGQLMAKVYKNGNRQPTKH